MKPPPHVAHRPSWECRNCGDPWPCQPARAELLAEHVDFPTVLRYYMVAMMAEASRELPEGEFDGELYARFLGWTP